ncbi:copper resistance D family protein [Paenibacillus agaridevorans]|uniref:copper resistance D family protein n=1 Tax=Paenibacillus agaridevorans TaxID=171404 RepID=UPI001BE41B51|nr:CopD family protein [Paenibacillus agaridevorans]
MFYWLTEPMLYLCFAIVSGYVLLNVVPAPYRPVTLISGKLVAFAALGIGLFSFFPILRIVSFFSDDIGWGLTFTNVMSEFAEGKTYWLTLIVSLLLAARIYTARRIDHAATLRIVLLMLAILIIAQGWISHVASWYGTWGILSQTLHILAVSLWVGPLLLAGWSKGRTEHWSGFLSWYHPMAILCFMVTAASGFVLTIGVAPEYTNAWKLPYGQALLIKHLLIVPLVLFAFINGFWIKRKLRQQEDFNPKIWAKAESLILLLIFSVTGYMNQQPAPHDVSNTLNESPASPLYLWFNNGLLEQDRDVMLSATPLTVFAFIGSFLAVWAALVCFRRKKVIQTFAWSLISAFLLYYGLMLAI